MAGLDFKGSAPAEQEDEAVVAWNTRTALLLFAVYVVLYGGFMVLSAFFPSVMDRPAFGGVNVAINYGFFLIVAA
ncbi:MAG: DUF485 domain-containing protein, partial [Planctomycetes bacterium]|nr:DUF485 domain-containing protein [Planctomycetota bacterium]